MNTGQAQAPTVKPNVLYYPNAQRLWTSGWCVVGDIWYPNEQYMHDALDTQCNLVPAPPTAKPPKFEGSRLYNTAQKEDW